MRMQGWVAELGEGVSHFKEGDAVAVYGPWGCGYCHACQQSMENYCENHAALGAFGGGLGLDGGMAEYMLVPSALLVVPLASLNPKKAAPLTDAALTPYHAIKRALPLLHSDSTVVIFGLGGLGHLALQLMRILRRQRLRQVTPILRIFLRRSHGSWTNHCGSLKHTYKSKSRGLCSS